MQSYLIVISVVCLPLLTTGNVIDDYEQAQRQNLVSTTTIHRDHLEPIRRPAHIGGEGRLDIYCYEGDTVKRLSRLWTSVQLRLTIVGEDFEIFHAGNEREVFLQYQAASRSLFTYLMRRSGYDTLSISPFNRTCVAISAREQYAVSFRVKVIDVWYLIFLAIGICLFYCARRLCRNVLFYYASGISVGVLASTLIVVFIVYKFTPYKRGAYLLLLGGGSVMLWLWQFVWENLQTLIETHYPYVLCYLVVVVTLSFAFCYVKGPVSNPRTLDVLQWVIQALGLLFIYNSTQIKEVSLALIVIILITSLIPWRFLSFFSSIVYQNPFISFWQRRFPKKKRLLTEDEYFAQGYEETRRALEELKEHCKSPDCNAWKTISRLQSPTRFAGWVQGDSQFTDEELSMYETDPMSLNYTQYSDDDESEIDFRLGSL